MELIPPPAPFFASPAGNCEDLTCDVDVFFAPTKSGLFFGILTLQVMEIPSGAQVEDTVDVEGTGVVGATATPLPATLPLFATGLGALGLLGWRRKRSARALSSSGAA